MKINFLSSQIITKTKKILKLNPFVVQNSDKPLW